ncbi:uncharacterized protein MELLADRAFT_88252 [Melampsora larici-populina 98AG31]|uniref:Ubinuclein middle domain-containing protein n=1 Tax=Melampsora larici-populina (strain 98AG31 / pathotype 3-4-7) TaxID=747676 RepID=F4RR44_MELLP|nr:uncharacterized protein MELLADRAFT_88252 [Melampsora larici-populina 98AG31]EGG05150.1 hypothetical protein MELLADRAFT_88252 [Melampsora larici-populina 98AG31]
MNADFLERLTKRARAEHGLSPTHGEDDDMALAPMLLPSDSGGAEPMDDEGDERPSGDSSDHQPGQPDSTNAIANSEHPPEDIGPVDEADDDDDEGTTDDDDENRPKKREIMPTIRLSLELPRLPTPTTVERSVSLMAKDAGYALPADTAITLGAAAAPEPELPLTTTFQADGGPPPKRRRRRKILERDEGYDRDDPFVDDSEALMMEPKFYHAPARDGFFVASGVLELKSDEKKTRNRKPASKVVKRAPLSTTLSHQPPKPISKSQNHQPSTPTQAPPASAPTGLNATSQATNSRLAESTDPRLQQAQANQKAPGVPSQATLQAQALPKTNHTSTSTKPTNLSLPPIQSTFNNADHRTPNLPPINSIADPTQTLGLPTNPINLLDEDEDRSAAPLPDASRPTSRHHEGEKPQKRERSKTSDKPDLATLDKSKSARSSHLGAQAHTTQPSGSKSKSPLNSRSPVQSVQSQTAIEPPNLPRWSDVSQTGATQRVASNAPSRDPPPSAGASDDTGASSWPTRLSYLRNRFGPVRKKDAPIAPRLSAAIQKLKVEVDAALPFEPRKFPPHLTPLTLEVAQLALDLNEYDAAFFSHLAQIFPYNTFTIKKLVTREILPNRKKYYEDQIDSRVERLNILIDDAMVKVMADHEKALADWRVAMEEWEKESNLRKTEPSTVPEPPPTNPISTENGAQAIDLTSETDKQPKPPIKTFKFTTAMRELYYEILKLEDELCETIQETQSLVDKNVTLKDTNNRKQLYSRLLKLWPEGFMSTTKLSREATNIRRKYDVPVPSSEPKPSS